MATWSSWYYLPEELVMKILSYFPVKYVLRCKLVCKQWLSITLNPDFIQTHLISSHKRPSVLTSPTVYFQFEKAFFHPTVSLISNSFEHSVNTPVPSSCPAPDHISTSCNGLICLSDHYADNIYLWNPSTRQGKKIPSLEIKHMALLICTGFYFDSFSNDYKILRLEFFYPKHDPLRTQLRVLVELYSAKSDSWIEIRSDKAEAEVDKRSIMNYGRHSTLTSGPVINRILYFNGSYGPISFQLDNKMLKPVPLPSKCGVDYEVRVKWWEPKVFEFEGSAALILQHEYEKTLSLWTLDDDDGRGIVSWTKKFNLEAEIYVTPTLLFRLLNPCRTLGHSDTTLISCRIL